LTDALQQGIREGLPAARLENRISAIDGPLPLFIDGPDLTQRVLKELKHYAEERSGEPMVSFNFNWVILRVSFDFVTLFLVTAMHVGRSQIENGKTAWCTTSSGMFFSQDQLPTRG
jgi:hypothetical protein